jgi:hypothetical protein
MQNKCFVKSCSYNYLPSFTILSFVPAPPGNAEWLAKDSLAMLAGFRFSTPDRTDQREQKG